MDAAALRPRRARPPTSARRSAPRSSSRRCRSGCACGRPTATRCCIRRWRIPTLRDGRDPRRLPAGAGAAPARRSARPRRRSRRGRRSGAAAVGQQPEQPDRRARRPRRGRRLGTRRTACRCSPTSATSSSRGPAAARTILEHGSDGVVAVHSLSKRSNLAGLRVGFYAGDAELVHYLQEVRKHVGHDGARPGAGGRRRGARRRRPRRRAARALPPSPRAAGRRARRVVGRRGAAARPGVLPVDPRRRRLGVHRAARRRRGSARQPRRVLRRRGAPFVRVAVVQPDDRIELGRSDRLRVARALHEETSAHEQRDKSAVACRGLVVLRRRHRRCGRAVARRRTRVSTTRSRAWRVPRSAATPCSTSTTAARISCSSRPGATRRGPRRLRRRHRRSTGTSDELPAVTLTLVGPDGDQVDTRRPTTESTTTRDDRRERRSQRSRSNGRATTCCASSRTTTASPSPSDANPNDGVVLMRLRRAGDRWCRHRASGVLLLGIVAAATPSGRRDRGRRQPAAVRVADRARPASRSPPPTTGTTAVVGRRRTGDPTGVAPLPTRTSDHARRSGRRRPPSVAPIPASRPVRSAADRPPSRPGTDRP